MSWPYGSTLLQNPHNSMFSIGRPEPYRNALEKARIPIPSDYCFVPVLLTLRRHKGEGESLPNQVLST